MVSFSGGDNTEEQKVQCAATSQNTNMSLSLFPKFTCALPLFTYLVVAWNKDKSRPGGKKEKLLQHLKVDFVGLRKEKGSV
jgi:hypothetical protein